MIKSDFTYARSLEEIELKADLTVIGGGLSGICTAITAARAGIRVTLVQDRPVLGGNSSSEIRLWVLGATSHMGNNNRWAREGAVIDELLVENMYRNPEGNPLIFDTVLLDKVYAEDNITLLLNTAVNEVCKSDKEKIDSVKAFCSQNSTNYHLISPLYCDASGDGIVAFLAGAAFRMGAESAEEFAEKFAPDEAYGELLGHSLYFYSKDAGKPVNFVTPEFALSDITTIPRFRNFNAQEYGCKLWWIEFGGRLDTVHDTEKIKWELWKVVYGVWNYVKNSGKFPEAGNLTLEWVGMIPGKRESRRFEGEYIISQQDIVNQRTHIDAVAYGGWSIDLHPADGVFSDKPGCNQWHSKGTYQIPYSALYSKNIGNLFLAGRLISATHVAFGSTRVMATGAHIGQAVGMAAKLAIENKVLPKDLLMPVHLEKLQQELLKTGQHIPGLSLKDPEDLVRQASISISSELVLKEFPANGDWLLLDTSTAQLLPLAEGVVPAVTFKVQSACATVLSAELRMSSKAGNFTPDITLAQQFTELTEGQQQVTLKFEQEIAQPAYVFICLMKNPDVKVAISDHRVTGILSVFNLVNKAVSNFGKQTPPADIGVEEFEFWCPKRRPEGKNMALSLSQGINCFSAEHIKNGIDRPTTTTNAWVGDLNDKNPTLRLEWAKAHPIKQICLMFDTDYDHPMETVLMTHPEPVMPFCVRNYKIFNDQGLLVYEKTDNYQTRNLITFDIPVLTSGLTIALAHPSETVPASLFSVRCYS